MKIDKKTFFRYISVCMIIANCFSFVSLSYASIGIGKSRATARRPQFKKSSAAAASVVAVVQTVRIAPTKDEINSYYQKLNELNQCVRNSCLPNPSIQIPSTCFNENVLDQRIENNCSKQYKSIVDLHPDFEPRALFDVRTKIFNDFVKACEGINGKYEGSGPSSYQDPYMSFGRCRVKVGYLPDQLNKGESYTVGSNITMNMGTSQMCNMSTFNVMASDMMSDGNKKIATMLEIQTVGALATLGVQLAGSAATVFAVQSFDKKNGQCVCKTQGGCNGDEGLVSYNSFATLDESKDPSIKTKKACETEDLKVAGFKWIDNFDAQIAKAEQERYNMYKTLQSGCSTAGTNDVKEPVPYLDFESKNPMEKYLLLI